MDIEITQQGDITIVTLQGELHRQTVPGVQEKLLPLLMPDCKILLDMSGVNYISSAGLRILLLLYRQVDAEKGRIVLTGLQEMLYDTMAITGFLDFFKTYTSVSEGLAALQQPAT